MVDLTQLLGALPGHEHLEVTLIGVEGFLEEDTQVTRSLDPTGKGQARCTQRWKLALNAFAITFADRRPAAENY